MTPQLATSTALPREVVKPTPDDEAVERQKVSFVDTTNLADDIVKIREELYLTGASTLYIDASGFVEKVELHDLEKTGVKIVDNAGVKQYLAVHPDMWQPVMNICRTASNFFPIKTQLSLEILKDPEGHEEHLVLYVRQKKYADNIMDIIETIWDKHEEELANMSGWLLVTTDFQPYG